MKYWLYSGCSLEASGSAYLVALEAVGKALGMEFEEIPDWNCCSASIGYVGGNEMQVYTLNARNLALAEKNGAHDIVAPCSSCYILMNRVNQELKEDPGLLAKVNSVLAEGRLNYKGSLKVRHILDVLYNDLGPERIKAAVKKPLAGIKVAGYVGCQTVRPYGEYDSMERPQVQDKLLEALGAEVIDFNSKMRCCGSGLFLTEMDACTGLVKNILEDALGHGAEIISTVCPMCQMNLEAYQKQINIKHQTAFKVPIVFLTQLMALALGLDWRTGAALNRNLIPAEPALASVA